MQKGIGISLTFGKLTTKEQFQAMIRRLVAELAKRMEKDQLAGLVVSLGLKFCNFHSVGK